MVIRIELFDHYKVFDIVHDDKHYYVYGLPYHDEVWDGKLAYPDGYYFYLIPDSIYAKLMVGKQSKNINYQVMVLDMTDDILSGSPEYTYIGNSRNYLGSEVSCVMQAFVKHLQFKDAKVCVAAV